MRKGRRDMQVNHSFVAPHQIVCILVCLAEKLPLFHQQHDRHQNNHPHDQQSDQHILTPNVLFQPHMTHSSQSPCMCYTQ